MATELHTLTEAIDALGALDVAALDDAELHAAVVALQRERARLGVVAARVLGCWDARRVWAGDGSRSAPARLARETACAPASAAVEVRRARQLRTLPATAEAIARGVLSLDHVDLLGRANQPHRAARLVHDEAFLVEQCTRLRYPHAIRMVAYWCQRADADVGHDDTRDPTAAASLCASSTLDGTVVVTGVLDRIGGAIVIGELGRLERQLYLADERGGISRTTAQRRAAALVAMAQRSATMTRGRRAPRPLFSVLIGERAFTDVCELGNGTVVSPRQLTPWLATAELETILFDGPSTIISVSRRRSFAGALRRAVQVRDRHCQHPAGCDVPAEDCDVDHIVPACRGGPTSQFNGRTECTSHNRHVQLHDRHATPLPLRPVTRLDELRARLRWRYLHEDADDQDDEDGPSSPAAAGREGEHSCSGP